MKRQILLLWTLYLGIMATINGQNLPSSQSIDWSTGVGVMGGIPTVVNIYDVTTTTPALKGDCATDNTSNLQALINNTASYPSPCVFYFPSGNYLFTNQITMAPGRVIRGNGATNSSLQFMLGSNNDVPCFYTGSYLYGSLISIVSGTGKGSTSITLSNASSFTVGNWIELFQSNECNSGDKMYTQNPPNGCTISWAANAIGQIAKVTGVSGNVLTIDRPLRFDFYTPASGTLQVRTLAMTEQVGFENFRIIKADNASTTNVNTYTFQFKNAANCWIKNIQSDYTYKGHAWIEQCSNLEIRDSYFNDAYAWGGSGEGYGVMLGQHVGSTLVENNVFNHVRHAMLTKQGASGNVFGYNFGTNAYWTGSPGIPPHITVHGQYAFENLFEGNIVQRITLADYWGPSGPGNTFLRNRVTASGFAIQDNSNYENIIGNEITGTSNDILTSGFGSTIANSTNTYFLSNNTRGTLDYDSTAFSINAKKSFYLSSIPSFFTAAGISWPSIGPGNVLGAGTIPSQQRFNAGFPSSNTCSMITGVTPGPNDVSKFPYQAYPIPFTDESGIVLHSEIQSPIKVAVINVYGMEVYTNNEYIPGTSILNDNKLAKGIYTFRLYDERNTYSIKIVKQ